MKAKLAAKNRKKTQQTEADKQMMLVKDPKKGKQQKLRTQTKRQSKYKQPHKSACCRHYWFCSCCLFCFHIFMAALMVFACLLFPKDCLSNGFDKRFFDLVLFYLIPPPASWGPLDFHIGVCPGLPQSLTHWLADPSLLASFFCQPVATVGTNGTGAHI